MKDNVGRATSPQPPTGRLLSRRTFLATLAAPLICSAAPRELQADVAIIGASVGGCAAALAALRNGMRVVLTEETDWIGGQLTSQGVPPDEHPWIEQFGCTRSYRDYRNAVRQYYRDHYPLTEDARHRANFNPGDGSVSKLTHEPKVSLAVLEAMLAPYASAGTLTLLLQHKPMAATVDRDHVKSISVRSDAGVARTITASYFLDATEQGDLLPLTRTEYVVGAESRAETGEPHAAETASSANIQSFTFCFAMDLLPGEDHTIEKPAEYDFWRDYVPQLTPAWPGKLLSWDPADPQTLKPRNFPFETAWRYRRIANRENFIPGAFPSDITTVNWPQNDYWLGPIIDVPVEEAAINLARARQLSFSLLYWLQTDHGKKGLRLRPDVMGTEDGMAKYPYIRESRRIRAEFTVLEQHVGTAARKLPTAEVFPDSVGVGSYRIDLHPSTGGDNYIDISSLPFQIPLGSLIPRRVENLLPACKNLGVTHITNGCYRLHPVEWNIGEAAGALAAQAIRTKQTPRGIRNDAKLFADFQKSLIAQGFELAWPKITPR
jgi:hypothetical protein